MTIPTTALAPAQTLRDRLALDREALHGLKTMYCEVRFSPVPNPTRVKHLFTAIQWLVVGIMASRAALVAQHGEKDEVEKDTEDPDSVHKRISDHYANVAQVEADHKTGVLWLMIALTVLFLLSCWLASSPRDTAGGEGGADRGRKPPEGMLEGQRTGRF